MRMTASVQPGLIVGIEQDARVAGHSGIDAAREAMTGVPHAIASSTGKPKPS